MAGMQRFVTYIYAYDNGQKSGNAGYAKIETRGNAGRMEIHLSGAEVIRGKGAVCFLKGQNGRFVCFPAGEFSIENGNGAFQMAFLTASVLETGLEFEQFDGIYIRDSHDRMYLSFWKDVKQTTFAPELFVAPEEAEAQEETKAPVEVVVPEEAEAPKLAEQPAMQNEAPDGAGQPIRGTDAVEAIEQQVTQVDSAASAPAEARDISLDDTAARDQAIEDAEQEMLHTMEVPVRNIFPQYNLAEIWQNMQKTHLSVQMNESVSAVQIELRDLRELPKRFWYLGNNSFLLHGFFNYHYLLFGKLLDGSWFLGVPGVYQKQECVMASIFGFPGFLSAGEVAGEAPLSAGQNLRAAENGARELQPGAWYHVLED